MGTPVRWPLLCQLPGWVSGEPGPGYRLGLDQSFLPCRGCTLLLSRSPGTDNPSKMAGKMSKLKRVVIAQSRGSITAPWPDLKGMAPGLHAFDLDGDGGGGGDGSDGDGDGDGVGGDGD